MTAQDWRELSVSGQFGFGRAGFTEFDSMQAAIDEALLYHDVEYIVKYKNKFSLRYADFGIKNF